MVFVKKAFYLIVLETATLAVRILHSQPLDSPDYLSLPDMAIELAKEFSPPTYQIVLALAPSLAALATAFPEFTNWPLFFDELCGHA